MGEQSARAYNNMYPLYYNTIAGSHPHLFQPKSIPTINIPAAAIRPTPKPDAESTTIRQYVLPDESTPKPEKLRRLPTKKQAAPPKDIVTDLRIFQARQKPDNTFDIKQIFPAERMASIKTEPERAVATAIATSSANEGVPNIIEYGHPSDGPISSFAGTTLLLEPIAKAISGNGGTSISAPVSRAILRRNSGTRVIFRPESVAIAGVGGTAHAQADLIIDYVD